MKHPIIQGGMHFVGYAPLVAAVSNAGGLGMITALSQSSPEKLRLEIRKTRELLRNPDAVIGVNLTILPMFTDVEYDKYVEVIREEKIKVVETAGRPPGEFISAFKEDGIKTIHKCVTVRHALSAVKNGADAISLDGFECAGHPGEEDIGNWLLLAMGARDLEVPFVASGGVGNGAQLASVNSAGRGRREHGHAVHGHKGGSNPHKYQAGAGGRFGKVHDLGNAFCAEHGAGFPQPNGGKGAGVGGGVPG